MPGRSVAKTAKTRDSKKFPARILLVDDDERNLLAMSEVLGGLAEVVTATSGREALRHLLEGEFAVILLDVFMPGMDGYETAQLVRDRQQTARIPIIFLSAVNKETEHLMRGYAMGAVDYVFKPVDAIILQSKVKVFVNLYDMRLEVEEKRRRERSLLDANLQAQSEKIIVERELRLAEERQAAIIESLPIVLYLEPLEQTSRRPSFVSANLTRVTGYDRSDVDSADDFWESRVHPDDRERIRSALDRRMDDEGWSIQYRWRHADGHYLHLQDQAVMLRARDGEPVEFAGSFFDITDRRALESQLLQAQKMDAIGQLTGGIAHDFNNLLASMLGGLHLLQNRLELGERDRLIVDQMRHAGEQGAELVRRMMAFARRQDLSPSSVDPRRLCESVNGLVAPTLGGRVKVSWDCSDMPLFLFVDRSQIELALVNLIINARDAMPGGGTVKVSIDSVDADVGSIPLIRVRVSDEGDGIAPSILDKVTEPFFTTKEPGKGTGLGLSMVAGFVEQSGGTFAIQSEAGSGTIIDLVFPSTSARPSTTPAATGSPPSIDQMNILLVDDDDAVRTVLGEQLADLGANVRLASSGEEALRLLETGSNDLDVILSDFAMPGLNGVETIAAVRSKRPDIGCVLMTGYADDDALAGPDSQLAVVRKPIALDELLHILSRQSARLQNAS
ncbi:MAG: response regulator [Pseudomonadota bacterium]